MFLRRSSSAQSETLAQSHGLPDSMFGAAKGLRMRREGNGRIKTGGGLAERKGKEDEDADADAG